MSELLLIAILNAVARIGIDGTLAFLEAKAATIDDAIAALKKAKEKSLQQYLDEAKPAPPA